MVLTFSLIVVALDAGLPFLFVKHKDSIYYIITSNPETHSHSSGLSILSRQEEKPAAQTGFLTLIDSN